MICYVLQTCPGLEQYAIQKFAQALETMPKILAENTGVKATEVLSQLYAAHQDGQKNVGVDVEVSRVGSFCYVTRCTLLLVIGSACFLSIWGRGMTFVWVQLPFRRPARSVCVWSHLLYQKRRVLKSLNLKIFSEALLLAATCRNIKTIF